MLHDASLPHGLLPSWAAKETELALLLPYVSLVDDVTIRTRGNELFQSIRLSGIDSHTTDDAVLDKTRDLFAKIVAQSGSDFAFYLHKVSKRVDHGLPPIDCESFASAVDDLWRAHLDGSRLREKTLTLTVIKRPTLGSRLPFRRSKSVNRLRGETQKSLRRLNEVVDFILSTFAAMEPRRLSASSGELLGFLGALNTGRETPLYRGSSYGYVAQDVATTRVTFRGPTFALSEGVVGNRVGASYAIKSYPQASTATMFDELDLPIDMVVTHSFTGINSNLMAGRITREMRMRRAADDGAISLLEEMPAALDDLETGRLSFGEHHMTATVFAKSEAELEAIGAEIRNIGSTQGLTLINESLAAKTHFFAQHPGNAAKRSRKAAITNRNFADFAAFHRTQMGKPGADTPWGAPVTLLPTVGRGGFRFNFHERGTPDAEPTGGHTLILGRPGSGKSVLAAFLMTQAKRLGARLFVFDYRRGMEMAVRANGGRYAAINASEPTGLNPLRTEVDARGQAWLADWLAALVHRSDTPLSPVQINRIQEVVRQNAEADESLRNWDDLASLFVSADDEGDIHERLREWTRDGRYGWIFGQSFEDTFSLGGDTVGFDLTDILDSESEKERMAVLSYLFRRVERVIEDRRRTIIVIDEAWKALDNGYFAERLSNWLVTARKQNAVVVMMTQYASQLERTRTGKTIVEAVPTQILLPNIRAKADDYAMLGLPEKELDVLLNSGSHSRLALVRDDQGSVVVDADLSALGPLLTILGGMEKGEELAGADYRSRPDFWRLP
ncbi:type IV secretion system protein B4 [Fulvimarina sp. 2208YS6-2-32]|uniref:Type IV secretion system protein B4 n=1 Tax=Fulvimarina uroteuthidis TaxID=3098149 RepID=A0ABU5I7Y4_9HYPH|nr:type IV secretion system protein B4 [Fulvimarina sp. 2208YS6-2-32]MDY8110933.1 type IV secretion system protein B4 [Fulvimarina sp. 2208YS6-2-32]